MVVSDCFVCLLDLFLQLGRLILRAFIEVRMPTHSLIYTDWLISLKTHLYLKRNPTGVVEGLRERRRGSEGTGKREWRGNFDRDVKTNKKKQTKYILKKRKKKTSHYAYQFML